MCFVKAAARIIKIEKNMVDVLPETQAVIGHGAFSVVYKACLKAVSEFSTLILYHAVFIFLFKYFLSKQTIVMTKSFERKTILANSQLI